MCRDVQVSGSWNKLRNALVDVENFRIWWTGKDARCEHTTADCLHADILQAPMPRDIARLMLTPVRACVFPVV